MGGEQDMRNMGDLQRPDPDRRYWTMFIATLAIAGIPPFAGFFSKDEILWQAWTCESVAYHCCGSSAMSTALMTAFYMFRLIYLTFHGQPRMSHEVEHHIHESPASMTMPLVVLAVMSLFAGFLGFPQSLARLVGIHAETNRFEAYLAPVFAKEAPVLAKEEPGQLAAGAKEEEHTSGTEYLLMLLSVGAALLAGCMAGRSYRDADKGYVEPINAAVSARLHHPAEQVLRRRSLRLCLHRPSQSWVTCASASWDSARPVHGSTPTSLTAQSTAQVDGTRFVATLSSWWDKWIIDGIGVNGPAILARMLRYPARLFEWGLVQWYALVMTAGLVGFVFYYAYR